MEHLLRRYAVTALSFGKDHPEAVGETSGIHAGTLAAMPRWHRLNVLQWGSFWTPVWGPFWKPIDS
jgi:hypothetical protein